MAIPWIIGGAVAVLAGALAKSVADDDREEEERQARQARRREEERVRQRAEEQIKRAQAAEIKRAAELKKHHKDEFVKQKAQALINKHRLKGITVVQLAELAEKQSPSLNYKVQQAYVASSLNQKVTTEIEVLEYQLQEIGELEKSLNGAEFNE